MKTWRERIAEAEQRRIFFGLIRSPQFGADAINAWGDPKTCLVGETVSHYYDYGSRGWHLCYLALNEHEEQIAMIRAIHRGDTHWLSQTLDALEDRALEFKREAR